MITSMMTTATDFFNSTGKRIKAMREVRDMTQTELAHELQIASAYISQIEKDKRIPSVEVLVALARRLDVSIDYLLMLDDEPGKTLSGVIDRYFTPEADAMAEIVDSMPPQSRLMLLGIARIVAEYERQRTNDDFSNLLGYVESVLGRVARQQVEQAMISRKRRNGGPA